LIREFLSLELFYGRAESVLATLFEMVTWGKTERGVFVRPIYFVFFVLLSIAVVAGEDGREFARDRWKISLANSESWRQYDCLVKVSTFTDGENEVKGFPVGTTWSRLAVDWDKHELFCLHRIEKELNRSEPPTETRADSRISSKEHLLVKSSDITRNVKYPSRDVGIRIKQELFPKIFQQNSVNVIDLRCTGILKTPTTLSSDKQGFDDVTKLVNALSSGEIKKEIETEEKVALSRTEREIILNSTSDVGTLTEVVDSSSLMRSRFYYRNKETGDVFMEESVSWFEVNGIYLPTEVLFERHYTSPKVSEFTSISVYWRSINEPLDRSLFEPKFLDDRTQVLKSSDVELYKAAGILNP